MHLKRQRFDALAESLIRPRILNYIVAAYLILVGILGLGLIR